MAEEIIKTTAACHTYPDGSTGIKNISLSVSAGEFIIIAGRNGSGKTTLIRHLNGLLLPDSGTVYVNGLDVTNHLTQTRQTIGMVFQDADTQIVGETVFNEVSFGLENLNQHHDIIREKVMEALQNLQLLHLKDRDPSTLSGGEKRKLAIAGILVMEPSVIVFDEPFSNLDYPGSRKLLSTILELNRAGHTIIIATHDIETVISHATRIILMADGKIKKDGAPPAVVNLLESFGVREPCSSKLGLGLQPW